MSVRGLFSWIVEKNGDKFMDNYVLSDTTLIIDGWNITRQLYDYTESTDRIFGGNYDTYKEMVVRFFERLQKCRVKPLVILSGGWLTRENIKKVVKKQEAAEIVLKKMDNDPLQIKKKIVPLLQGNVLVEVLKQRKIKFVMCPLNADNTIVTLAKKFDTPILTRDAEFFVHEGIECIPITRGFVVNSDKTSIKCKIFRIRNIQKIYPNFELSYLPLILIMLGDNIYGKSFQALFRFSTRAPNFMEQTYKNIDEAIKWLSQYPTFESAIASIALVSHESIEETRALIHDRLESHTAPPSKKVLEHLGINDVEQIGALHEEPLIRDLPCWFLTEFLAGHYDAFLINMIKYHTYCYRVQAENFRLCAADEISLKIIQRIYQFLMNEMISSKHEDSGILDVIIRGEQGISTKKLRINKLNSISLENLRQLEVQERVEVIHDVLEIPKNNTFEELPEEWALYVATAIYWMRQNDAPRRNTDHLKALLLGMVLKNIVDDKFLRNEQSLSNAVSSACSIQEVKNAVKKKGENGSHVKHEISLREAVDNVRKNGSMKPVLSLRRYCISQPQCDFDITLIHVFAQFQSCLKHSMNLNALLKHPYIYPHIPKLFNGTLVYNLYVQLFKKSQVNSDIQHEFGDELFQVYQKLMDIVLPSVPSHV